MEQPPDHIFMQMALARSWRQG